ncbi:unnamed protein product [Rotaria sordida]|uniref:Glutathione S-transferase n=2 Tax=Rotaria sordida TaxID=392033 RepID=A0A818PFQ8_9BILA|nr:unnamed protein product [Rotaria sordida]
MRKILLKDDIYLYWASGSIPCWRVQIALSEKHIIDYKHQMISLDQNEHKMKPIIDQNLRGQIPSLKIGNIVLNESLAICFYLEDLIKNQGIKFLPQDPYLRAQVLQCTFDSLRLQKFGSENVIYYIWHTPPERYNIDLLNKRKEILVDELIRWNNRFKQKNQENLYAVGNLFTLADIFLLPQLAFLVHCGYPIRLHEQLDSYYKHLCDRPSIHQSFPPHWLTTTSNILTDCSNLILKQ